MIVIVNTGGANIASIRNAIGRLGRSAVVSQDPDEIFRGSQVILPGVGSASMAMDRIASSELLCLLQELRQPTLGICLGMQLLFTNSTEGNVPCLGVIPGSVRKMTATLHGPLPHMGWNRILIKQSSSLLRDVPEGSFVYFAHSFHVPINQYTIGITRYGIDIPAVVERNNYFGTQFHPEKSSQIGLKILGNFLDL